MSNERDLRGRYRQSGEICFGQPRDSGATRVFKELQAPGRCLELSEKYGVSVTIVPSLKLPTNRATGIVRYNSAHTAMISGRIGCELVVLAVLGVLTIFLFPGVQGPYSVTRGPATALQAARAAARLRTAIVQGALNSLGSFPRPPLVVLLWLAFSNAEFLPASAPEYNTVLRC